MPQPAPPIDPYVEYAMFLHPSFDPNQFAHSIVNNEPYPAPEASSSSTLNADANATTTATNNGTTRSTADKPPLNTNTGFTKGLGSGADGGDVSAALGKLNFGVEDLQRQLKAEITKHHSSLLLQAASLGGLESDLSEVRDKLAQVEGGVQNLRKKITVPYQSLANSLTLLTRLRRASSLARRAARFVVLARRLEGQMADIEGELDSTKPTAGRARERKERAMAEAALTLAELETLLKPPETQDSFDDVEQTLPLRSLQVIEAHVSSVELSRRRVVEVMETEVQRGLNELDNPLLASSLQTAHNLSVLPALVDALLVALTELVQRRVKSVFDLASIAREVGQKEPTNAAAAFVYKSRTRTEPTTATMPQWASVLWTRLETLMSDLGSICIKTYTLEKVLKLKRDQTTQQTFLDEAMGTLDNKPSSLFWTTLGQTLEAQAKEAAKSSPFIQTTFSTGYPRLLRFFHEFFARIGVHTDTVYTASQQSPETVVVLRAIQPFEALYLARSSNRLNEAVSSSFSVSSSLSASFTSRPPTVPTANEGLAVSRAVVNELDAARFDPLLVKSVALGATKAVESFVQKSEHLIAQDHSATSLVGPIATPSQHTNADLTSALYHLWSPLNRALGDHAEVVRAVFRPSVDAARRTYLGIATPLILAIRRDFSTVIARMHRVDYSKGSDSSMGNMSASVNGPGAMSSGAGGGNSGAGPSAYMVDLMDKMTFVRDELLGAYKIGDLGREWALDLARFTVQTFVLHASIVKNLSENGKLKLTSDVASLEFGVSQFLASYGLSLATMGDQFKTLRAFRPMLFLDDQELGSGSVDVPSLVLMHHVVSRSNGAVELPHQVNGWTESEYVRWLNEHGEVERVKMIEMVVRRWEDKQAAAAAVDEGGGGGGQEVEVRGANTVRVIKQILERHGSL